MGSWRGKPWLLWAALTVPAAATLAGIGTYTRVLGPEDPPKPSRADLVGRYEDGHGAVVTLKQDGSAVLSGVEYVVQPDPEVGGEVVRKTCASKHAYWSFTESLPRWNNQVHVLPGCVADTMWWWDATGTPSAPRLVYYVGDSPPLGRRVLTRR